jgi:hypothetical protein
MATERGCLVAHEYCGRPSYDRLVASVVRVPSVWTSMMHGTGIIFRYSRGCSYCILSVGKKCYCFPPHIQLSTSASLEVLQLLLFNKTCYTGLSLRKVYLEF